MENHKIPKLSFGDVGIKYFEPLKRFLAEYYDLKNVEILGTKLYVFSNRDLNDQEFKMGKKTFKFVLRENKFEVCKVKQLS